MDDIEAFWEFVKAQATQVAHVWQRLTETERAEIRTVAPLLADNLDALAKEIP
jgi:hypothetical protein